jgi:glutathione S-transferase
MLTLYYAPRACSLAPHALLEEAGLPYRAEHVDIFRGAHLQPDYLRLNPRARVPALRLPTGEVLTEVVALLTYIAEQAPERGLLPREGLARARCYELLSFLASRVHPAFGQVVRPDRFSPEPGDHPRLARHGVAAFLAALADLDALLDAAGPYALGPAFGVADPYVLVFYRCARYVGLDVSHLARLRRCAEATQARPAVQRTLAAEGLQLEALPLPAPGSAA